MRIAKRGGGYREAEAIIQGNDVLRNLVPLPGATGAVEVLTADETEANKVHLRIVQLKQRYQETQFELARLLWRVNEERLFTAKSLGAYDSFREYVESELGFSARKGQMLVTLHWWYGVQQKGEPALLEGAREIGWTKAHHLVNVVDAENAEKWFSLAKTTNEKELIQHVRAALAAAGKKKERRVKATKPTMNPLPGMNPIDPEPETPTTQEAEDRDLEVMEEDEPPTKPGTMMGVPPPSEEQVLEVKAKDDEWTGWAVRIPKELKAVVEEAIELAKKLGKTDHSGIALSLISQHFLSFSHDKMTVMIGEWLAAFERNTGLKVIAVDPKDEQVVYGQELLQSVGEEKEE